MSEAIIVAIITGGITLAGTVISNLMNHSKTMYRIDQLERKVEKHNNLVERMYICEGEIKVLENDIGDLKGKL
jgi:hypothetical protein